MHVIQLGTYTHTFHIDILYYGVRNNHRIRLSQESNMFMLSYGLNIIMFTMLRYKKDINISKLRY